jgi:hypothetical protein
MNGLIENQHNQKTLLISNLDWIKRKQKLYDLLNIIQIIHSFIILFLLNDFKSLKVFFDI